MAMLYANSVENHGDALRVALRTAADLDIRNPSGNYKTRGQEFSWAEMCQIWLWLSTTLLGIKEFGDPPPTREKTWQDVEI